MAVSSSSKHVKYAFVRSPCQRRPCLALNITNATAQGIRSTRPWHDGAMAGSLIGRLLVAGPRLIDPNFFRTVVLVCAHGSDGALGVILNRPTDIAVGDHLPGWVEQLARPEVVFIGGPVQSETAIGLGRRGPREPEGWTVVDDRVGLVDLTAAPGAVAGDLESLRVFSGYAGWGPDQLEAELETGDWVVASSVPDDAFREDTEGLWRLVLRREGGRTAIYAEFPLDPSLN